METKLSKSVALVVGLLLASLPTALFAAETKYAGEPLEEALSDLQSKGLDIFYTSNLVKPEMRVGEEPTAGEPREILAQLLAPHGLTFEDGPGGRLVVVAAKPETAGIRGRVRRRRDAAPIPGVRILIPGAGEALSGDDGSFLFAGVAVGAHALEAHLPGFVVGRLEVTAPPGRIAEVVFDLAPAPLALDEIIVTPSRVSLMSREPVAGMGLDREDILALPHLGDDIFRALTLLPGVTGEETSARFHVRGGRADEVLVLLDRVELFEPYHMKDYSSPLSIITPRALSEVHLITGGFPVQYGDRMSGVLEMSTVRPSENEIHMGLGTLSTELGKAATFQDGRGHWLASARRGALDLTLEFLGAREKPHYWDAFGKAGLQLSDGHSLGLNALYSDDQLVFFNIDPDFEEDYRTSYGNSYLWLTHQAILGPSLFVDSTGSIGQIDRDRRGREEGRAEEEGQRFTIRDTRSLEVVGFKQDWNWVVGSEARSGDGHYLKWGLDVRRFDTHYDYFNARELDDPLEDLRSEPRTGTRSLVKDLRGEQYSAYLSDRLRPADGLTLEVGVRYDEHTLTEDRNVSPRLNLVFAPGADRTLRAAWGYFYQSQRPYELQIEDGITELTTAERTEQRVLGFERSFLAGGSEASDLLLRVEAYQRIVTDPRPRYENIYEPISIYPEIEPDRVLFAPELSRAYGLEILLRGSRGRIDWWGSYTYSRTEDRLDGVWVPRRIDQPHAFNFDINYRAGRHWNVNLAWRLHSGWPTTSITGELEEDEEGELEVVPVLGPLNGDRLPVYHRLDLRASREWQLRRGVLGFYVDVQNVYDRGNIAGFDVDLEKIVRSDGTIDIVAVEEIWGGILPSFGITWRY